MVLLIKEYGLAYPIDDKLVIAGVIIKSGVWHQATFMQAQQQL